MIDCRLGCGQLGDVAVVNGDFALQLVFLPGQLIKISNTSTTAGTT